MARLLFPSDDPWFDELKIISSYSESELEKMILSHVDTVFPNYVTIPFKKVLNIPSVKKGKAPDLAIISRDYKEWWIIEVETDEDDLVHVKSQLQVFTSYDYNNYEVAKYMHSKDETKFLQLNELIKMVRDIKPQVLVMVDEVSEVWNDEIKKLGATICVFQVYKNKDGSHAFRINGDYPKILSNKKSHCEFLKSPGNTLRVNDPDWLIAGIKGQVILQKRSFNLFSGTDWSNLFKSKTSSLPVVIDGREIEVDFVGKVSKWRVIQDEEKLYLKPIGNNKVPVVNTYQLYSDSSFKLYLKHN
ncbi:MAG TPA: hypothetical protein VK508_12160 [Cyclobacteriaceae bacterium]|nr:hypothetical protein [Cyclobacteriaceae bacterium]